MVHEEQRTDRQEFSYGKDSSTNEVHEAKGDSASGCASSCGHSSRLECRIQIPPRIRLSIPLFSGGENFLGLDEGGGLALEQFC